MKKQVIILACVILFSCQVVPGRYNTLVSTKDWVMGPFIKEDSSNPCITTRSDTTFYCKIRKETIYWEKKDVFNPAAVVRNGKINLLYRAEDNHGTSRIGRGVSMDGLSFTCDSEPVFYPDNDFMKKYEWPGGCEDPRIVEDKDGTYYMTYTSYDNSIARLCVASSRDLINWEKHGLAFEDAYNGKYIHAWSKSGSIVCKCDGSSLIATLINSKYWMYWGDTDIYIAISTNLKDWTPVEDENGKLKIVFSPRDGYFDSRLVEPGPPAILTKYGIVFIYNSMNLSRLMGGDPTLPEGTYAAGQVLLNSKDPTLLIDRTESYFLLPEKDYEITGQVNNVCFLEGLVYYNNKLFLYYGAADSKIAVATYTPE